MTEKKKHWSVKSLCVNRLYKVVIDSNWKIQEHFNLLTPGVQEKVTVNPELNTALD